MLDTELVLEILRQIEEAAQKVIERFKVISMPGDFTDTPTGMEKMDSIWGDENRLKSHEID